MDVITKMYDLVLWGAKHVGKFPRSHRFTLGDRLEVRLYAVLEMLVRARYTRDRVPLLRQVNVAGIRERVVEVLPGRVSHMAIAVFISHSSRDEKTAAVLASLLQQALGLRRPEIRCTSAPGHKLPAAVEFHDTLRSDIASARAFIGLVTPASLKSDYVLFEMGARWGAGLPVLPLRAGGCLATDVPGPLARIIAKHASDAGEVTELREAVGRRLERDLGGPASYHPELHALVKLSVAGASPRIDPGRLRNICHAIATRPRIYDVWVPPELGDRRLENLRARLRIDRTEDVIAWIENSKEPGKDGMAVLISGICWRDTYRDRPQRLTWSELKDLRIDSPTRTSVSLGGEPRIDLSGGQAEGPVVAELLRELVRAARAEP
jgi:hypothetical protein